MNVVSGLYLYVQRIPRKKCWEQVKVKVGGEEKAWRCHLMTPPHVIRVDLSRFSRHHLYLHISTFYSACKYTLQGHLLLCHTCLESLCVFLGWYALYSGWGRSG